MALKGRYWGRAIHGDYQISSQCKGMASGFVTCVTTYACLQGSGLRVREFVGDGTSAGVSACNIHRYWQLFSPNTRGLGNLL